MSDYLLACLLAYLPSCLLELTLEVTLEVPLELTNEAPLALSLELPLELPLALSLELSLSLELPLEPHRNLLDSLECFRNSFRVILSIISRTHTQTLPVLGLLSEPKISVCQ